MDDRDSNLHVVPDETSSDESSNVVSIEAKRVDNKVVSVLEGWLAAAKKGKVDRLAMMAVLIDKDKDEVHQTTRVGYSDWELANNLAQWEFNVRLDICDEFEPSDTDPAFEGSSCDDDERDDQ